MNQDDLHCRVRSHFIDTPRLRCHMLESGDPEGVPLIFIHGNLSSSVYFEAFMQAMPANYRCLAVDLRGYGKTQDLAVDATRGARDWSDDLFGLCLALDIPRAHLVGWSLGAAPIMQFALDHSAMVMSLTLLAPVSPFGFGGSRGVTGQPCHGDYAGSGGGNVHPDLVSRIEQQDMGTDDALSPLTVIRESFVAPPFRLDDEQTLLAGSLELKTGEQRYPGDVLSSPNWPYTRPGNWGPLNAISPRHLNLSGLVDLESKPPVLWLRGSCDSVISDESHSDPAVLGAKGLIPDWPGKDVYPPQPMVAQMRVFLSSYMDNGGYYREIVLPNVGHSPFLENPDDVYRQVLDFFRSIAS